MQNQRSRHFIDILFTLALFCVFAVCALMVVVMGADVYRKVTDEMQRNFDSRTSLSYISTKLRQSDAPGAIYPTELDGLAVLVLEEEIDGRPYQTLIYSYQGSLREQFVPGGLAFEPGQGEAVMELGSLECRRLEGSGLIEVIVTDPAGGRETMLYSPRCWN